MEMLDFIYSKILAQFPIGKNVNCSRFNMNCFIRIEFNLM